MQSYATHGEAGVLRRHAVSLCVVLCYAFLGFFSVVLSLAALTDSTVCIHEPRATKTSAMAALSGSNLDSYAHWQMAERASPDMKDTPLSKLPQ
mmetsp:Transcript_15679/g.39978  ORF Transcript_15679/g.39978 Transcript_15679/m.39978 type:complete len:94 (-) Transcript_15679:171-452(-)